MTPATFPPVAAGLSDAEVAAATSAGHTNVSPNPPAKTPGQIILGHAMTLFNLINALLAAALLFTGAPVKNLLFLFVVVFNLCVGVVQELRAARTVAKLSLLSAAGVNVVRAGQQRQIPAESVVPRDILLLKTGQEIPADSYVLEGVCEVNEAFVTGESDPIEKRPGDALIAGSFVVSGSCAAGVHRVGHDNYIATLSAGVKQYRPAQSEIIRSIKRVIKVLSIVIVPLGILLFWQQCLLPENTLVEAVQQTAAAIIGMIPEGLVLLTSTVLALGVLRLSRQKVLVREMYCIEALARVDTLCLDKTGTLTTGELTLRGVVAVHRQEAGLIAQALCALTAALPDQNATAAAVAALYNAPSAWQPLHTLPFSSARKYSAATFAGHGTFLLGAPDYVGTLSAPVAARAREYAAQARVLMLFHTPASLPWAGPPDDLRPLAFLLLEDTVRPGTLQTLTYFREQGVDIKVISGDNVRTAMTVARQAGVERWEAAVDMSQVRTAKELERAAQTGAVFGRVTPQQKKQLVAALKRQGHTVAMVGDGVNDVLALREADCSVALASGAEAACGVSHLVLLRSNFEVLPRIVAEGRRCIGNIERSASLFLVKTLYATLLAMLFALLPFPYPFIPIHFTLLSTTAIGIPSFILALESNRARVQGRFLRNVLLRAVPAALTIVLTLLLLIAFADSFHVPGDQMNTVALAAVGLVGLLHLSRVCQPFTRLRLALLIAMCALFIGGVTFTHRVFDIAPMTWPYWLLLPLFAIIAVGLFDLLLRLGGSRLNPRRPPRERRRRT